MLSRPRLRFALHNDRSPRLFQALDRELGDGGPQPVTGDRGRLVLSGTQERTLTGLVLPAQPNAESLAIDIGGHADVIPVAAMKRVSLSRGSYGHAKEGGVLGFLLGGLIGFVVAADNEGGQWGVEQATGYLIGSFVGGMAGAFTGSAVRTEVWSEVTPERLGRRIEPLHAPKPD